MRLDDADLDDGNLGSLWSRVKGAGKAVGRGAAKGTKFAVKTNIKGFILLNKLALKGFCKLPGPAKTAAVGAALTASTGGAGAAAAPVVSDAAADALCKAMRTGKQSDMDAAQRALEGDGVGFKRSWWQEILHALGLD